MQREMERAEKLLKEQAATMQDQRVTIRVLRERVSELEGEYGEADMPRMREADAVQRAGEA
jgi:hypothetical protein